MLLLVVAALLLGAAAIGVAPAAPAAGAGLRIARPDGSAIQFSGAPQVWCGPWEQQRRRRTIHVELRNPDRAWELRAVLADVDGGQRIRFPTEILAGRPRDAMLFVYRRRPLIEASTNEEEAAGSLAFSAATCEPGGTVSFGVHAVLGSELFGGARVRVDGSFSGVVGEAPAAPARPG
jgi:hypothetical protein